MVLRHSEGIYFWMTNEDQKIQCVIDAFARDEIFIVKTCMHDTDNEEKCHHL